MKLEIKVFLLNCIILLQSLRITGTEFSDLDCTPCKFGYSQEGSDRCSLCPQDFYLNPLTVKTISIYSIYFQSDCVSCPDGTHSEEGSIAIESNEVCKIKRDCTIDEIPKSFTQSCK